MMGLTRKTLVTATLSVGATLIAGSALAGGDYPPPPPPSDVICHNIGGPRDLGANCENTGNCSVELVGGGTIVFTDPDQFLGIVIGASDNAAAAHIAHGDGFVDLIFDPPLHLASVIGPHRASNVECMGTRIFPQPPEPGN
ncbi:MAG TPA: hypothetical protein VLD18_07520 [Verrucomicrobiae bacterium]|nr:hypothetical protein [Verrucomicrobiae bacterium]